MTTPCIDFETYSEAGYTWLHELNKWANDGGLGEVGTPNYAAHPSTEILFLAYDLQDGWGPQLWLRGMPCPQALREHIEAGRILESHNLSFEWYNWHGVLVARYGWPALNPLQVRCSKAKARAYGLPGALDSVAKALGTTAQKDDKGKAMIKRYSMPRNPTKADPRRRIDPLTEQDGMGFGMYCVQDVVTETAISGVIPDLSPYELEVWRLDQTINRRGVAIDVAAVHVLIAAYEDAARIGDEQMRNWTSGAVDGCSKVQQLIKWLETRGIYTDSVDAENIEAMISRHKDRDHLACSVLRLRADVGSASVKKLYTLRSTTSADGRLRELFEYHGAHTGRWTGKGAQPQNLPSKGPKVVRSECCGAIRSAQLSSSPCPYCGIGDKGHRKAEWGPDAVDQVIADHVSIHRWPDRIAAISGCLRGLFVAAPGCELISSDYSAIEAVVLAVLASEQWRIDVFRTHGKIYEMSAAKITGIPFEEILAHKTTTGEHHPARKGVGKVAELASGYGGWIGAWKAFGADEFMVEQEIKQAILAWRAASPAIVQFWGGQVVEVAPWQFVPGFFGLEGAAVQAVLNPGQCYAVGRIVWGVQGDVLKCQLPSGRFLHYHRPRLERTQCRRSGCDVWQLFYTGVDSKTKQWRQLDTYGGKLTENVVQAVARDILADAMLRLEAAGYPVVMHVHDEIVSEVPHGFGSIEEFEAIMSTMPAWAADWPLRAAGGWRGRRYRKE